MSDENKPDKAVPIEPEIKPIRKGDHPFTDKVFFCRTPSCKAPLEKDIIYCDACADAIENRMIEEDEHPDDNEFYEPFDWPPVIPNDIKDEDSPLMKADEYLKLLQSETDRVRKIVMINTPLTTPGWVKEHFLVSKEERDRLTSGSWTEPWPAENPYIDDEYKKRLAGIDRTDFMNEIEGRWDDEPAENIPEHLERINQEILSSVGMPPEIIDPELRFSHRPNKIR